MPSRIERLLIALLFTLVVTGVTWIIASAQAGTVPPAQTSSDCATCHTESQVIWQNGAHGKSGSNPIFLAQWNDQGKRAPVSSATPLAMIRRPRRIKLMELPVNPAIASFQQIIRKAPCLWSGPLNCAHAAIVTHVPKPRTRK